MSVELSERKCPKCCDLVTSHSKITVKKLQADVSMCIKLRVLFVSDFQTDLVIPFISFR